VEELTAMPLDDDIFWEPSHAPHHNWDDPFNSPFPVSYVRTAADSCGGNKGVNGFQNCPLKNDVIVI